MAAWAPLVRQYLLEPTAPVLCRASDFCKVYGTSMTSLRRRLNAEGTSWLRLRNEEVLMRAERMLANGMSSEAIAWNLGYAFPQNMERAYRTMTGETITEARARLARKAA